MDEEVLNEFQFNSLTPDRNLNQTAQAVNIAAVNVYQFMDEAYFGSGGFRNGNYLIPFSRESDFRSRKQLAHYKGYVRPIIRAMVEPIFSQVAPRVVTDESGVETESLFKTFLGDCDAAGNHIQTYTHKAVNICRRAGVVFTVMDNFSGDEQPATLAEAERLRVMPYVYHKKAQEVESFECDKFGNIEWIIFYDGCREENKKRIQQYRKWTTNESQVLEKDKQGGWVVISTTIHGLGKVPVIASFSDSPDDASDILPDPPLYDLARLNLVIYNQSAEIRDQERAQAFSIFFGQGLPEGDSVFGPKNFINLGPDVTIPPGYASPDFGIIAGLVANQEQIRKDLFLLAEQAGVVGVASAESGIAKAFDFFGMEDTLKRTSVIASELELKISELFKLYTNEVFEYIVSYPTDFAPMGLDREIDRYDKVFKITGLNKMLIAKLQEKLARLLFADDDRDSLEEIIQSIRDEAAEPEPEPPVMIQVPTPPEKDESEMGLNPDSDSPEEDEENVVE